MKIKYIMSSFKRLLAVLVCMVVTILFAGILELFCTPYTSWFSSLQLPQSFGSADVHNVCWLVAYLTIAYAMSASITNRDYLAILLWGVVLVASIAGVALIFTAKKPLFATIAIAIATSSTIGISARAKHSSWAMCLVVCWYIYLLMIAVITAVIS